MQEYSSEPSDDAIPQSGWRSSLFNAKAASLDKDGDFQSTSSSSSEDCEETEQGESSQWKEAGEQALGEQGGGVLGPSDENELSLQLKLPGIRQSNVQKDAMLGRKMKNSPADEIEPPCFLECCILKIGNLKY